MYILNSCLIGKIQGQRLTLLNVLVGFFFLIFWYGWVWFWSLSIYRGLKNLNLRSIFVFFSFSTGIKTFFWHLPCFIMCKARGRVVFSSLLRRETIQWQNYMTGFYFCGYNLKAVSSTLMCFSYVKSWNRSNTNTKFLSKRLEINVESTPFQMYFWYVS